MIRSDGILSTGFRFGLVGVAATLVHLLVAFLVLHLGGEPLVSNTVGFIVALGFTTVAHHVFSFARRVTFYRGAVRYVPAAVLGFLVNSVLLATLDEVASGVLPAWLRIVIAVGITPVVTFFYARYYAYR